MLSVFLVWKRGILVEVCFVKCLGYWSVVRVIMKPDDFLLGVQYASHI